MIEFKDFELEVKGVDMKTREVEFYAAAFNNIDSVRDIILPGAFKKTIAERGPKGKADIAHLYQHDSWSPIGKPLEMAEDDYGLAVKSYISKSEEDKLIKYNEGILKKHSIGFRTIDSVDREDGVRILKELQLFEVSTVTFPANELAGMKSLDINELKRIERLAEGNKDLTLYIEHLKTLIIQGPETPEEQEPTLSDFINQFKHLKN